MAEVETKLGKGGVEVIVDQEVLHTTKTPAEANVLAAWVRFQLAAGTPLASVQKMLRGEPTKDGAVSGGVVVKPDPAEAKKEAAEAKKAAAEAKKHGD